MSWEDSLIMLYYVEQSFTTSMRHKAGEEPGNKATDHTEPICFYFIPDSHVCMPGVHVLSIQ